MWHFREKASNSEYRRTMPRSAVVLVFVPALVSTVFLLAMYQLWLWSEALADREHRYTEQTSQAFGILHHLLDYKSCYLTARFTHKKQFEQASEKSKRLLREELADMAESAKGDPLAEQTCIQLGEVADKALDMSAVDALAPKVSEDVMTLKINQAKQVLAVAVNGLACSKKAKELVDTQREMMPAIRAKQETFRLISKALIAGGFATSFAIILAILVIFDKRIRSRLRALMAQARTLADHSPASEPIPGNGELEYISRTLAAIKTELNEAAERRRSILHMVAHDVRSPLMASQLSIDLIAKMAGQQLSEHARGLLAAAKAKLKSIVALVNELLDEARTSNETDAVQLESITESRTKFGLTKKVMLIAIAPLVLQAGWLLWLNDKVDHAEKIAVTERRQQDFLVGLCGLGLSIVEVGTATTLYTVSRKPELRTLADMQERQIQDYFRELHAISEGDPPNERFLAKIEHTFQVGKKAFKDFDPDTAYTDISGSFKKVQTLSAMSDIAGNQTRVQERIISAHRSLVETNRQRHKELASSIQSIFMVAIAGNLLFAMLLLSMFVRNVSRRVDLLIKNVQTVTSKDANPVAITGNDELHELDVVLRDAAAQLQLAAEQRLQVTTALTDKMRTPLQDAASDLEAIRKEVPESEHEEMQEAQANMQRVLDLIGDLMDMRTVEGGSFELNRSEASLSELVSGAVASVRALALEKQITITDTTTKDPVFLDRRRMSQVLVNILSNAIKFSPAHSTVTIKASTNDGNASIEISDQGPGIPDELRDRVFDARFQVKRDGKGFGLGLAISKAIVDAHGGTIQIRPVLPNGATFAIVLPESHTTNGQDSTG